MLAEPTSCRTPTYTTRRGGVKYIKVPFPTKVLGEGEGTGAPPSPSPLNLERWHQASHSLIDIRPGGPSSRIYCRGALGAFGMFHWGGMGGDGGGWGGRREAGLEHDQTG